jgi:hypothetical protein
MILIAGIVFMVLGLLSGLLLVLAPFGLGTPMPGMITWALFPLLSLIGYLLVAMASRVPAVLQVTRAAGAALLALALVAAVGLFAIGTSLIPESAGSGGLWFVLAVGLIIGTAGLTLPVFRRAQAPDPER